ncbi:MAG: hypothetical protein AB9897_00020 [Anaerolineaceae bacterium]
MKAISAMTQIEIAAFVQTHLLLNGVKVVLSGGAATAFFSHNQYVSADIDLVNIYSVSRKRIDKLMNEIGFTELSRYFKHPESEFIIEFPPGPLTVGLEAVGVVENIPLATGTLHILSATDCIKDRLAAFYHWGDKQCLQQSILVGSTMPIDLAEIERWSIHEGKENEFKQFLRLLNPGNH